MDLTTTYMGLKLKHPIVPSASPLSRDLDSIRSLEDSGAPAIVMYSLFEEQIRHNSDRIDHFLNYGTESYGEALNFFPDMATYNIGPDEYVNLVYKARRAVDIPIIGSLNGVTNGGWIEYARKIEEAGANGLEVNIYYIPTDPDQSGADVEQMYLDVVREVKQSISIPVAVKLSPYFSSTANIAKRLAEAGADALVLFNRFYQPDLDIENLEVVPHLVLSNSDELRLPLRWVAILYGRVPVDLAITTGVHTHEDVLKGLMAGARVTMLTSELLQRGPKRIGEIVAEMDRWLEEREYISVAQLQGSMSQIKVTDPAAYVRANYMKILQSWRPDPACINL
jgi:dihydroorotate dehydrogenase (fumarate)